MVIEGGQNLDEKCIENNILRYMCKSYVGKFTCEASKGYKKKISET